MIKKYTCFCLNKAKLYLNNCILVIVVKNAVVYQTFLIVSFKYELTTSGKKEFPYISMDNDVQNNLSYNN